MKKRLLSVLLSLAMIVGLIPTTVLAVEPQKKYVSLGDSMTNGYGLDNYEVPNADGSITNWFGFQRNNVEGSYPWKVADRFGWKLSQIATSGLRADDVYYLLNLGTDYEVNWDDYGRQFMAEKFEQSYVDAHGASGSPDEIIAWAAEQYQAEVEAADVISIGIGSNNFATLMDMRMMWWMGRILGDESMFSGGGYQGAFDFNELVSDMTDEQKAQIAEVYTDIYAEIEAILMDSAAKVGLSMDAPLAADGATLGDLVADMANAIAYTSAGFALGYKGTIDTIIRENDDAEIIIVGLTNWFRGMVYGIPVGEAMFEFPMGDLMELVCDFAGVYMAALPAAYEAAAQINDTELQPIYFADTNAAGVEDVELIADVIVNNTAGVDLNSLEGLEDEERFEAAKAIAQSITSAAIPGGTTRARLLEAMGQYVLGAMGMDVPVMAEVEACEAKVAEYYALPAEVQAVYDALAVEHSAPSGLFAYLMNEGVAKFDSCVAYLGLEKSMISSLHLDVVNVEHFQILSSITTLMTVTWGAIEPHMQSPNDIAGALIAVPELGTVSNLMFNFLVGSGVIVHPSDDGHTTIANVIVDAYENKHTATDETIQNLNEVLALIAEYYDEAYAYAYDYAEAEGYIAAATAAIDDVIKAVEAIEVPGTDAFKAEVAEEIEYIVATLEAAKALLTEADELDQASLDALMDTLGKAAEAMLHLEDLLVQAGVDVNQLAIIPALQEAYRVLTEEVIPQIDKQLQIAVKAGAEYLKEKLGEAYDALIGAIDAALTGADQAMYDWLYNNPEKVIAFFAEYGDEIAALTEKYGEQALGILAYVAYTYGDEMVDYIINNPEEALGTLVGWYDEYGYRVWPMIDKYLEALGVYDQIEDAANQLGIVDEAIRTKINEVLEQVKAELEEIKKTIDEDIAPAVRAEIEALIAQIEAQIDYLEAVVSGQIEAGIEEITAALKAMDEAVKELFAAVKAEGEALAQAVVAELQRVIDEAIDAFMVKAYYATNLTITKCAYPELTYLALGGATAAEGTYAEIIAEYLEAANADNAADAALAYADLLTYITENAAAIAGADVITYQMDANEIVEALVNVMLATATGGEYTSPEWSNYVDVEGINEAQATAQALQAKVAQYLRAEDLEALESIENQVMARIDAAIDEETMEQIRPYAECLVYGLVSYAVENAKAIEAIKTINPDAEIVMLGLYNTLNGVTVVVNGETIDLGELFDYVVEAVDVYNLIYAVVSENVTIVNISGAAVDGAELNVDEIVGLYAKLQGGGLTLDEMLAAGEAIEVALANVEAAVYGTANAEGQAYIAEQIKAAVTVMDHDYIAVVTEPTCTEAGYTTYTCSVCGDDYVIDGEGATGHVYDNDSDAFCNVCGHEREISGEDPIIPDPGPSTPVTPSQPTLSKDCDKGANCPLNAFPDLSVNEWYHNGIHYCVENKLMQGYLDGTFGANININRGQIVTILWRQAGSPAPKSECTFKDVPKGMYCYDAVAWANENGIALGYEDGTFRPGQAILRQQLVTFFYRYAKWSGADMTAENTVISAYSDAATVSAYAIPAMKWAIGTGVIQGYTDSTIRPHGNASRAHAAAVVQRFCEGALK